MVFSSFLLFLEIKTTLNPKVTNTSTNPSPIPSVAPVTTTQLDPSYLQYFFNRYPRGINCLTIVMMMKINNLIKANPNKIAKIIHIKFIS